MLGGANLASCTLALTCLWQLCLLPLVLAVEYNDPNTGLQWKLLAFPLEATSLKVANVYQQSMRPAKYSELQALISSQGASLSSIVTALGGSTGTVYNDTAGEWLTASLAANPAPSTMYKSTVEVNGAVFAVGRTCNPTYSIPVNIPDIYVDMTVVDRTIDVCMCHSQWSGPKCDVYTTSSNCQNSSALQANTGQQILAGGSSAGASIDTIREAVSFNISSPNLKWRNVTSFSWVKCDNNATVNGGLVDFRMDTATASCNDAYWFSWRVADLENVCGLQKAIDPPGHVGQVRYRGDLMIYYVEWADISSTIRLRRKGRLVTPVDVFIDRTEVAELTTNSSIKVFSPFELKAAIVATIVKSNATTSYMDLAIAIPAPYAVIQIAGGNPLPSESKDPNIGDVAWSCLLSGVGTNKQQCTPTATWSDGSGLSDCIY